jgi:SAM-dependent methyltransferase
MNSDFELLKRLHATPRIFEAILSWSPRRSEMQLQSHLRTLYPDDVVRAALSVSDLRKKGMRKFSRAAWMWFDRVGLEQSTSEWVAVYKAARFSGRVWDLCCGVGGDSLMLAERCDVLAVDRSPAACLRTRWNAEAYQRSSRVTTICADVEALADRSGLVHIDPDRRAIGRSGQGRSLRLEEGSPGLEFLERLTEEFCGGAIKASPAANFLGKFPAAEIELISLNGECKEATIWFGSLANPGTWRATALPSQNTISGHPLADEAPVAVLGRYLFDPNPALVRAGLVDLFAVRERLARLDPEEEYLTADELVRSPFVDPFEVLAELPNNEREIREYFRNSNPTYGSVEIKCRRIPIDVEAVRRKLPLLGNVPVALVFARISGRARAVVCRRIERGPQP